MEYDRMRLAVMVLPSATPEQRRSRLAITFILHSSACENFANAELNKLEQIVLARSQIGPLQDGGA